MRFLWPFPASSVVEFVGSTGFEPRKEVRSFVLPTGSFLLLPLLTCPTPTLGKVFRLVSSNLMCHTWCWPKCTQKEDRSVVLFPKSLGSSSHSQTYGETLKAQEKSSEEATRASGWTLLGQHYRRDSGLGFAFEERRGGRSLMTEPPPGFPPTSCQAGGRILSSCFSLYPSF